MSFLLSRTVFAIQLFHYLLRLFTSYGIIVILQLLENNKSSNNKTNKIQNNSVRLESGYIK